MKLNMGFSNNNCKDFTKKIEDDGYAIFSKNKNKKSNYYPNKFPKMEEIELIQIHESDVIEIRAFFKIEIENNYKIESGLITAKIETIVNDEIYANILTELPSNFSLQRGITIELRIDEIIRKIS